MIQKKVSEKEKYKNDGQWFKDMMKYSAPYIIQYTDDYEKMKVSYQIVNNDLTFFNEKLKLFCNPLGDNIDVADEQVEPYPELHNCVSILKGEMIGRRDTLNLLLLTSKAIKEKDTRLIEAIKQSIDEKAAIELSKHQMELQQMSPEEIAKFEQDVRTQLEPEDLLSKNWMSETEIFYNKALKFVMHDQNVLDKKRYYYRR